MPKPFPAPVASKTSVALMVVSAACLFFMVATIFLWSRNSDLQRQLAAKKAQLIAELEKGIAQDERAMNAIDRADAINAVCGIYLFEQPTKISLKMDLRSDGTAMLADLYGRGKSEMELNRKVTTWYMNGGLVTVGGNQFKVEGYDLIDAKGNRWLRVR